MAAPIRFEEGKNDANRIGEYEVLEVDRRADRVRVRYLSGGQEAVLTLSLKERIGSNIQSEKRRDRKEARRRARKLQRGYGERFEGLAESDFKNSIAGTTWRSRAGLGGLVARLLEARTRYAFVSKDVSGWPVVCTGHRDDEALAHAESRTPRARFMLELDEERFDCGFCVERSDEPMGPEWDPPRFGATWCPCTRPSPAGSEVRLWSHPTRPTGPSLP